MDEIMEMGEEDVLRRLLDADAVPERTVVLERIGIPVTLRGLNGKQVNRIREQCTERTDRRGQAAERLDTEQFHVAVIAEATVKPDWGDQKLLSKHRASGPEEVLKRVLLAGEIAALSDAVLDLSGFNTRLQEVKN